MSTNDKKVVEVAKSYGLSVPFIRPDELASDTASTFDVILHALNYYKQQGVCYDLIVLLQPTLLIEKRD